MYYCVKLDTPIRMGYRVCNEAKTLGDMYNECDRRALKWLGLTVTGDEFIFDDRVLNRLRAFGRLVMMANNDSDPSELITDMNTAFGLHFGTVDSDYYGEYLIGLADELRHNAGLLVVTC